MIREFSSVITVSGKGGASNVGRVLHQHDNWGVGGETHAKKST